MANIFQPQSTWYVGVHSGYGDPDPQYPVLKEGGLYKTVNRGVTWVRILETSNDCKVTSCAIHPTNPDIMYVTSLDGLWYSNNANTTQPTFSQLESYPFRQPERVFFNPYNTNQVWVTSYGNGLRVGYATGAAASETQTAKSIGKTGVENSFESEDLQVYPIPFSTKITIRRKQMLAEGVIVKVYNQVGKLVF